VEIETNDRPLVLTGKVEGSARFLVDNEVDLSRFHHFDTGCEDGDDMGGWTGVYIVALATE